MHGFPFNGRTIVLKSGDDEKLKAVLGDKRSYKTDSGEKKCGGFHPDYALGWTVEGKQYACLICFGCREFRLHGPAGGAKYDIAMEAAERLKRLLAPYQQNRPAHSSNGP